MHLEPSRNWWTQSYVTVIEKGFLSELNYFVLKFSTAESDCLTQNVYDFLE